MAKIETSRKVTPYVMNEAYKWLYEKIRQGEYKTNRCREADKLFVQIKDEQKVTEATNNRFLELFDNDQFGYLIRRKKAKNGTTVTTDVLSDYFVSYGKAILPIGFIYTFFEDDYETRAEIKQLLREVEKDECECQKTKWDKTLNEKNAKLDAAEEKFKSILHPSAKFIILNSVKLLITVFLVCLFVLFLQNSHLIEVTRLLIRQQFNIDSTFVLDQPVEAYIANAENYLPAFNPHPFGLYLTTYLVLFIVEIFFALILISRIIKSLRFIVFLIRSAICAIQIRVERHSIAAFRERHIDSLYEDCKGLIPNLVENDGMTDAESLKLKSYIKLYRLTKNTEAEQLEKTLTRIFNHYHKFGFTYAVGNGEKDDYYRAAASWKKGIVGSILLAVIMSFINIPELFTLIAPYLAPAGDFISSIM